MVICQDVKGSAVLKENRCGGGTIIKMKDNAKKLDTFISRTLAKSCLAEFSCASQIIKEMGFMCNHT